MAKKGKKKGKKKVKETDPEDAAVESSRFPAKVSETIKENSQFLVGLGVGMLQGCHLIPQKEGDAWIEEFVSYFGQSTKYWNGVRATPDNGVALLHTVHSKFDRDSGSMLALLPRLHATEAKDTNACTKAFLLLYAKGPKATQIALGELMLMRNSIQDMSEVCADGGCTLQFEGAVRVRLGQLSSMTDYRKCVQGYVKDTLTKEALVARLNESSNVFQEVKLQVRLALFLLKDTMTNKTKIAKINKLVEYTKQDDGKAYVFYEFSVEDCPSFAQVRGHMARALRLLQHPRFKGLKNGGHSHEEDFSLDADSQEETKDMARKPHVPDPELLKRARLDSGYCRPAKRQRL